MTARATIRETCTRAIARSATAATHVDECADLDDARHPGRAQMRSAIDDADNNRAGW